MRQNRQISSYTSCREHPPSQPNPGLPVSEVAHNSPIHSTFCRSTPAAGPPSHACLPRIPFAGIRCDRAHPSATIADPRSPFVVSLGSQHSIKLSVAKALPRVRALASSGTSTST